MWKSIFGLLLILAALYYWIEPRLEFIASEQGNIEVCMLPDAECKSMIVEILESSSNVKAALYDLDDPDILRALKDNGELLIYYKNHQGIGQRIYKDQGLMHNKFYIPNAQDDLVITGSANPTKSDMTSNRNNILIIHSSSIRRNYLDEFYELRNSDSKKTKTKKINLSGILVENYFCPEDGCEQKVVATLRDAKKSIHFMTYSFTSDEIGDAIIAMKGIDIRGSFDSSQAKGQPQLSEYHKMIREGLDVRLYPGPGRLHHKVFIIDSGIIITGSYNPTSSGNSRNDENLLIIRSDTIAQVFKQEFESVMGETN